MLDKIIENKNQHKPSTHRLVGSSLSGTLRHTSGQQAQSNSEANWDNQEDRSRPGDREEYLKLYQRYVGHSAARQAGSGSPAFRGQFRPRWILTW